MPLYFMLLMLPVFSLGLGIAYIANPRFVERMVTKDRTGQKWARMLGQERAIFVIRNIFSLFFIVVGIVLLYFSYENY
jgi:hypothetical protein